MHPALKSEPPHRHAVEAGQACFRSAEVAKALGDKGAVDLLLGMVDKNKEWETNFAQGAKDTLRQIRCVLDHSRLISASSFRFRHFPFGCFLVPFLAAGFVVRWRMTFGGG